MKGLTCSGTRGLPGKIDSLRTDHGAMCWARYGRGCGLETGPEHDLGSRVGRREVIELALKPRMKPGRLRGLSASFIFVDLVGLASAGLVPALPIDRRTEDSDAVLSGEMSCMAGVALTSRRPMSEASSLVAAPNIEIIPRNYMSKTLGNLHE